MSTSAGRFPSSAGGCADSADQVVGVGIGERGQPGDVVAEHLGGDPAEPEHYYRAEYRFLHDADDGLDAAGDHGLDQHPGIRPPNLACRRPIAARTSSSPCRSSSTAPAAVLCSRPGTSALITT